MQALSAAGLPAHPLRPHELAACLAGPVERHPAVAWLRLASGGPVDELAPLAGADDPRTSPRTRWINDVPSVRLAHDKAAALARLAEAGLPVPPTRVVTRDDRGVLDRGAGRGGDAGRDDDAGGLRDAGAGFVVKPPRGAAGRGVTVGLPAAEALAAARAFAELTGAALVQPVLGGGVDHRLVVADGRVLAAMRRRPPADDGRANLNTGGSGELFTPDAEQTELALEATRCLGLDVAGVDLLVHDGRPLVLEVNSCPGVVGLEAATGQDLGAALARFVHELAHAPVGGAPAAPSM